jgi:hypothetical protein
MGRFFKKIISSNFQEGPTQEQKKKILKIFLHNNILPYLTIAKFD